MKSTNQKFMNCLLVFFSTISIATFAASANPISKDEIFKKLTSSKSFPSLAFRAEIKAKISAGGFFQSDSGELKFSPPDCFRLEMVVSRTTQMGCGDTLWSKAPDGRVTMTLAAPGEGLFGSLDLGRLIKDKSFEVAERDSGKYVEIAFKIGEKPNLMDLKIIMDRESLLYRRAILLHPSGQTVEIGYAYQDFKGQQVLREINTVLGPAGFVRMTFSNYATIKKHPRKYFRGF